jgi:hypothetical protein
MNARKMVEKTEWAVNTNREFGIFFIWPGG